MQIRRCDLKGPEESLTEALEGIDVVISCVGPAEQQDQIPLAKAAKRAGVKRFVPCGFITVAPPGGIMWLRDEVSSHESEGRVCPQALTSVPSFRKKQFTTMLNNCASPTPSSMSAGGTNFRIPAWSPDEPTML